MVRDLFEGYPCISKPTNLRHEICESGESVTHFPKHDLLTISILLGWQPCPLLSIAPPKITSCFAVEKSHHAIHWSLLCLHVTCRVRTYKLSNTGSQWWSLFWGSSIKTNRWLSHWILQCFGSPQSRRFTRSFVTTEEREGTCSKCAGKSKRHWP